MWQQVDPSKNTQHMPMGQVRQVQGGQHPRGGTAVAPWYTDPAATG